ncbi:hypothetical protein COU59_00080 [Candidatus Pacearchaeota archaeon CG10_big_fil_rev_8_21_14_0_10_34_12]|nr:MAG: hypothetical protein COU59_00080 [Candidatus Pacearchaeota archaeon CG10_big_fil_rev_8_21_14_0_10_34_12]
MAFRLGRNLDDISQIEFLTHFLITLRSKGLDDPRERDLHQLFYDLCKEDRVEKPIFFKNEYHFDLDSYPTSPSLSRAFNGCAITFGRTSPDFRNIAFSREEISHYLNLQERFSQELRDYLEHAVSKYREPLLI